MTDKLQLKEDHFGCCEVGKLQVCPFQGPNLVFNHAADFRQEVLADDAVQVAVLWGGFILDALRQPDPLLFCFTHKRPRASLIAWKRKQI